MAMTLVRVADTGPVVDFLTERLQAALAAGQRVLWLIPGGSAIAIAAAVSQRLPAGRLGNLHIGLTDERYGPVGHPDSNWQQLTKAGFVFADTANEPVLHDVPMDREVQSFEAWLDDQLSHSDYRLGFFGMGADGHTAGILPDSPAVTSSSLAAGYDGGAFQRITMTGKAIAQLDEAVLYAAGPDKHAALDKLEEAAAPTEQPAQFLKLVNKLTVFNDLKGDTV